MKRVIVLPDAEIDIKESVEFYDEQDEKLSSSFINIIDTSFKEIKKTPETFPLIKYDIRKFVVNKFSFCIYFVNRLEAIYIIAVFHDKRNPKDLYKRKLKKK